MIRWEEQPSGDWNGYSGQVLVATATRDGADPKRWNWEVTLAGKLKGVRNSGHRTSEVDARRSAEAAWQRWLEAMALKPDLMTLAEMSLPKARAGKVPSEEPSEATDDAPNHARELERLRHRAELAEARFAEEQQRGRAAEERAEAAEAKLTDVESTARERLERIRAILDQDEP